MSLKEHAKHLKLKLKAFWASIISFSWVHILTVCLCFGLSTIIFWILNSQPIEAADTKSVLTNILTVNGIFSAILISYLFSRITWAKERKLDLCHRAVSISQKITEYRRILNKLTAYYNVWESDKSTKSLMDHGAFKTIDFYDFKKSMISDYRPSNYELIQELWNNHDFKEGQSTLYLAMISLVKDRRNPHYQWQEELYKDFEINGIYNISFVERWMEGDYFNSIWYWLDQNNNYINYDALNKEKDYILSAISRINKKYKGQQLSNNLLKELTDDFASHYLNELHSILTDLKRGITDLNLIILVLITLSLICGVLAPLGLLLVATKTYWYMLTFGLVVSINLGLISYFVFRFPILLNREMKLI